MIFLLISFWKFAFSDEHSDEQQIIEMGDIEYGQYLGAECASCHQQSGASEGIPALNNLEFPAKEGEEKSTVNIKMDFKNLFMFLIFWSGQAGTVYFFNYKIKRKINAFSFKKNFCTALSVSPLKRRH